MTPIPTVTRLVGVYDADGGWRGELVYVAGKLRGTAHCALCEVTHSPVRRKRQWDEMVTALGVPFDLMHRNERPSAVRAATPAVPVVVAEVDGTYVSVLEPAALERLDGDVGLFRAALTSALEQRRLVVPGG